MLISLSTRPTHEVLEAIRRMAESPSNYIYFEISGKWYITFSLTNPEKPPRIIFEESNTVVIFEKDAFIINGIDVLMPLKERGFKVMLMGGPYWVSEVKHIAEIVYYYYKPVGA